MSLGLLVGGVTYRNPALHAKMTTTLDVISGGRAIHGLGAAWFEAEHDAYGVRFPPLKERFEHLEDALRIARAMFTEEKATVEGTHHHVADVMNNPRPIRGDIPILIGGSGERKTLRLVAQYADGCNLFGDVERVRHLLGVLDGHCETVGRDPAEITRTRMASVIIAPTHEDAQRKLEAAAAAGVPRDRLESSMLGDPDTIAEQAQAYADIGIQGLTITLPRRARPRVGRARRENAVSGVRPAGLDGLGRFGARPLRLGEVARVLRASPASGCRACRAGTTRRPARPDSRSRRR